MHTYSCIHDGEFVGLSAGRVSGNGMMNGDKDDGEW